VEGFEGLISGDPPEGIDAQVAAFLDFLVEIALRCDAEGLFSPGPVILSAGGSAFYDLVTDRFSRTGLNGRLQVVLRSGCYLTHDSRMYKDAFREMLVRSPELKTLGEGLRPALEVWSYVQARPESELAIVTLGKRDCGFDAGFPVPLAWFRPGRDREPVRLAAGYEITNMNDQHAFLRLPADSDLAVGDMVVSGISHPCTTFDKWQLIPVVNDEYDVVSAVRTFF
jgi:D-serine dehydratase